MLMSRTFTEVGFQNKQKLRYKTYTHCSTKDNEQIKSGSNMEIKEWQKKQAF